MGIVYKAQDKRSGNIIAIKQLLLESVDPQKHDEFKDRFVRESKTALRLNHENIVKVLEVSENPGDYFYVMEYLDGRSLRDDLLKRSKPYSIEDFWPILRQITEGLSFAHAMNVVHRDVKPDNIFLLRDGTVKITDFGIARAADFEATHLTKTGVMLGTLAYVSPEQLQNAKNVDHRADIFSLAVVTYEALSGKLPFTGEGIAQTIVKIMSSEEVPLNKLNSAIPEELAAVVSKALRKKPKDRYRATKEFLRDFQVCAEKICGDLGSSLEDLNTWVEHNVEKPIDISTFDSHDTRQKQMDAERAKAEAVTSCSDIVAVPAVTNVSSPSPVPSASSYNSKPQDATEVSQGGGVPFFNLIDYTPITWLKTISHFGDSRSTFEEPNAVAYRSGRLVISDAARREAYAYNNDGRWVLNLKADPSVQQSKTNGGRLSKPSGIVIDERGRIYVCDSSDHFIRVFNNQGNFIKDFKNIQGKEGGLQGIALDTSGLLYASDQNNGCLQVFQSDMGLWVRTIGAKGREQGQFQLPAGLTCDKQNRIIASDYGTSRISIFNKTGMFIRSFGEKGKSSGMFNLPKAVAVDRMDRIFVLDSLNHRIQVFGSSGNWLCTYGSLGKEKDQFCGPSDLCIDNQNNLLFVADKGNKRIQVLELKFK
ncbi:MAG: protein kinase [Candidatus Melainabacteria bacterium]|nr:MAG: protein kinase [Candidatus Melainabacteria bacterium]